LLNLLFLLINLFLKKKSFLVFVPKVALFVDMNFPADAALFFSQKLDVPAGKNSIIFQFF